jgi:hypothetical protein
VALNCGSLSNSQPNPRSAHRARHSIMTVFVSCRRRFRVSCGTTRQPLGSTSMTQGKSAMQKRWDFHDDNLLAVNVISPREKGALASVQIDLQDDTAGVAKRLSVAGCANIRSIFKALPECLILQWETCLPSYRSRRNHSAGVRMQSILPATTSSICTCLHIMTRPRVRSCGARVVHPAKLDSWGRV